MWFNKKQNPASERAASSRSKDMRSELGISGDTHQSVRVRSRQVSSDFPPETAAIYDEQVQLHDMKIRARRRLIGAVVLLAAAFVILPWVFDGQRKQTVNEIAVAIPEKNAQFEVKNPKATDESLKAAAAALETPSASATDAKPSESKPSDSATVKTAATSTAAATPAATPAPKVETKPVTPDASKPAPTADKAATASTTQYAVHIGVVSDQKELSALLARLRAAGVQPQLKTVTVDGVSKTRVRLGLFKTQAEAEAAAAKARGAAKNPVVIPIDQSATTKP